MFELVPTVGRYLLKAARKFAKGASFQDDVISLENVSKRGFTGRFPLKTCIECMARSGILTYIPNHVMYHSKKLEQSRILI